MAKRSQRRPAARQNAGLKCDQRSIEIEQKCGKIRFHLDGSPLTCRDRNRRRATELYPVTSVVAEPLAGVTGRSPRLSTVARLTLLPCRQSGLAEEIKCG